MKGEYLIFTGFVEGYGGIAKAKRLITCLQERGIYPLISTEENYSRNLVKFGLRPDITIRRQMRIGGNYLEVAKALNQVDYEMMISFGPRTFGPKHATDTGRRVVIVDGGLPSFLGGTMTDHAQEVYQSLDSFILTCHFPWYPSQDVLADYPKIPVQVCSQPVDQSTYQSLMRYRNMTKNEIVAKRNSFCLRFGHVYKGEPILPVRMSSSLLEERNLEENGGWLKKQEFEQTKLFLEHFITTLGITEERATIPINSKIAKRFQSIFANYQNITVLPLPFLPLEECLELSKIAHLNIERAMRDVTQFEIAASGSYVVVCPCPTNYMHEDITAEEADKRGIIKHIPITTPDLGSRVLEYIGSNHYYTSRERRISFWDEMHSTRNIIDAITESDRITKKSQNKRYFDGSTRIFS